MTSGSGMFRDAASSRMLQRFWERQAVATANSSSLSGRGLPQRNSNDSGPNNKSQQAAATSRWECGGIAFAIMCLDEGAHHYMLCSHCDSILLNMCVIFNSYSRAVPVVGGFLFLHTCVRNQHAISQSVLNCKRIMLSRAFSGTDIAH